MTGLFFKQLVRNCLSKSQTISFSKIKKNTVNCLSAWRCDFFFEPDSSYLLRLYNHFSPYSVKSFILWLNMARPPCSCGCSLRALFYITWPPWPIQEDLSIKHSFICVDGVSIYLFQKIISVGPKKWGFLEKNW